MQKIKLSQTHKKILTEHAQKDEPNESCAILFGKDDTVSEIFLTENIEKSPVNFTISNDELIEAYKIAEEKKMEVMGIFHSHPNSEAYPSNTDKKFMQGNPVVWIIYSGTNEDFRGYTLESDIQEILVEFS